MAVSKYIFAVNSDLKLSQASYTHPSVLKYYKKNGHKEFKSLFDKEELIWTDAVIGKIQTKENYVQAEMKIALKKDEFANPEENRISIYALSDDQGLSWFFVEDKDYRNQNCGNFKRLIK